MTPKTGIAIVMIPHQRPAYIDRYANEADVISAAREYTAKSDRTEPEDFGEAVSTLADDMHGHIACCCEDDLWLVHDYTGHQQYRVRALFDDVACHVCLGQDSFTYFPAALALSRLGGDVLIHCGADAHNNKDTWGLFDFATANEMPDCSAREAHRHALEEGGMKPDEIEDEMSTWQDD